MSNSEINTVTILGTGNVAWHLNRAIANAGLKVNCISSRNFKDKDLESGLIIISVLDGAIAEVVSKINNTNSILVHTSGSIEMDILKGFSHKYGVFYPLQTFTKGKELDFSKVPICLESSDNDTMQDLKNFASILSENVYEIDSVKRRQLHLSAVFSCNFVNHFLGIAREVLEEKEIPFEILFPLIEETISKAKNNNPYDVQTGPAIRKDYVTMDKHKDLLKKETILKLYDLVSQSIIERSEDEK